MNESKMAVDIEPLIQLKTGDDVPRMVNNLKADKIE